MPNKAPTPAGNTTGGTPAPAEGTLPSGGAMPAGIIQTSPDKPAEDAPTIGTDSKVEPALDAPADAKARATELEEAKAADAEKDKEMRARAQPGVSVQSGEEVYKPGDTPEPAPKQDNEVKPAKPGFPLPPEPSPGRTVKVDGE